MHNAHVLDRRSRVNGLLPANGVARDYLSRGYRWPIRHITRFCIHLVITDIQFSNISRIIGFLKIRVPGPRFDLKAHGGSGRVLKGGAKHILTHRTLFNQ